MTQKENNFQNPGDEKQVPLQDVVLSNSFALQSILMYLEEQNPGARERIWKIYQAMQKEVDQSKQNEQNNQPSDSNDQN